MSVGSYPKIFAYWETRGLAKGERSTNRIGKRARTLGPKKLIPDKGKARAPKPVETRVVRSKGAAA